MSAKSPTHCTTRRTRKYAKIYTISNAHISVKWTCDPTVFGRTFKSAKRNFKTATTDMMALARREMVECQTNLQRYLDELASNKRSKQFPTVVSLIREITDREDHIRDLQNLLDADLDLIEVKTVLSFTSVTP